MLSKAHRNSSTSLDGAIGDNRVSESARSVTIGLRFLTSSNSIQQHIKQAPKAGKKMSMPSAEGDAAAIVAAAETSSQAPVQKQQGGDDGDVLSLQQTAPKLAPFTPSGDGVLGFAMELLQLSAQDVLFDLGCGDARILVHAAQTSDAR